MGAAVPVTTDTLVSVPWPATGGALGVGDMLVDASGQYRLTMQANGDLVLTDEFGRAWWGSGTAGSPGATALLDGQGHLWVISAAGVALWKSNTANNPGATLVLQMDRNLVLYAAGQLGVPAGAVWSTGTDVGGPTVPPDLAAGTVAGLDADTGTIFNDGLGGFYVDAASLQDEGLWTGSDEATGEDVWGNPIVEVPGPPAYNVDGSIWGSGGIATVEAETPANAAYLPGPSTAPSTAPLITTAQGTVVVASGSQAGLVVGAVVVTTDGSPVGVTTSGQVVALGGAPQVAAAIANPSGPEAAGIPAQALASPSVAAAGTGVIGVVAGTPAAAVAPADVPVYSVNQGAVLGFGPQLPGPGGAPTTPVTASPTTPTPTASPTSGTTVYWILGTVVVGLGVFLVLRRH